MDLILVFGALLIVFISHKILDVTYARYKNVEVSTKITGYEAAKKILSHNGLTNIRLGEIDGNLTDHYNNSKKVINLSRDIYEENSIAAVSVAAHECGHAIQYKEGYFPIKLRNGLVHIANFGSNVGYIIIGISLFSSMTKLFTLGIILILVGLSFQIVTLPVEFDASKRGKQQLIDLGIISRDELGGAKSMLRAAAFTYVAGLLSSLMQVLRYILIFVDRNRD